jgi:hypothetical protein
MAESGDALGSLLLLELPQLGTFRLEIDEPEVYKRDGIRSFRSSGCFTVGILKGKSD